MATVERSSFVDLLLLLAFVILTLFVLNVNYINLSLTVYSKCRWITFMWCNALTHSKLPIYLCTQTLLKYCIQNIQKKIRVTFNYLKVKIVPGVEIKWKLLY